MLLRQKVLLLGVSLYGDITYNKTMLLGFKTELKLNNQQRTQLAKHAGVARHAYNWGLNLTRQILNHNQVNPKDKIKFPSAIDLHKLLVAFVKPENPWYYESSKCAPQFALRQLREAWTRAFNKVSKPPKFKKKGRNDSFTLDGTIKVIDHWKIQVPKIGILKTYEGLLFGYKPKNVTISRKADRWFISFRVEVEPEHTPKSVEKVGVDLGIKTLAYLSTGIVFEGVKAYKKLSAKLSRMQYLLRKKVRGSANWKKAQQKIARLHMKIANIRKDNIHKITSFLAKNHGKIVIEDLNVFGMLANHKLALAIQDMGFFEFRRQLEYKSKLYGSEVIVVDRFFPSSKTCSNCNEIKKDLTLTERVFQCDNCGFELDRDLNASINLEKAVSCIV